MRRRGPTPEDAELWRQVASTVEPLRRRRRRKPPRRVAAEPAPEPAAPKPEPRSVPAQAVAAAQAPPAPPPRRPAVPPIAPIDRHERRQVVRGSQPIEARIDLHGLRQAEAHSALAGFLALSQHRGYRFVLVITGKGGEASAPWGEMERGVLRRLVPHWLRLPEWRGLVLGFEPAHRGHGGDGALYVRLRRSRGGGL